MCRKEVVGARRSKMFARHVTNKTEIDRKQTSMPQYIYIQYRDGMTSYYIRSTLLTKTECRVNNQATNCAIDALSK